MLTLMGNAQALINQGAACPDCDGEYTIEDVGQAAGGDWPVAGYTGLRKLWFCCTLCGTKTLFENVVLHHKGESHE